MQILDWQRLDAAARHAALARPAAALGAGIIEQARAIIEVVRRDGDAALLRYAREFDGAALSALQVTPSEFTAAQALLGAPVMDALRTAIENITAFHAPQMPAPLSLETQPGVRCERLLRPIRAVGLYVPAGSAPLPSTVLMLAVPARLAGCPTRVLCTPPQRDGTASAAVLMAARLCGIDTVYKAGGAQAIAALAYGTASIPKVDKIFGPGNAWVTAAKQLVAADADGAALDLPAGPSEVLVIADDAASAEFVAADLLAQAEHDASAQALLVSTCARLTAAVAEALHRQAAQLSRRAILARSIASIRLIVVPDVDTAVAVSEAYAPEHLIIQTRAPRVLLERVSTAGSVFLGPWSPETLGDYCSGTNHVLPTYGYARAYSGLSVVDFTRRMTVQEISATGLRRLGPVAQELARLEGLDAHASAVTVRLAALASPATP
ncbi:MAG: histidinol dehydrogenase [Gammaproteobacteria bacterium]|nr:histidinol dehydrogenase [Gammaproteobacteria bacterium]